jgi:5'-nucleotidase
MIEHFGCVGNTIRLRSGLYLDLADPQPDQFEFSDIAGALSKICRFGGQCERFYSVAEHSWHAAKVAESDSLPLDTQAAVLMHDAAEAFIGDVVKPLKVMLSDYLAIEQRMEAAIAEKFTLDFEREKYSIREIDHAMLIAERQVLFSPDCNSWVGQSEARKIKLHVQCWEPSMAELRFASRAIVAGVLVNEIRYRHVTFSSALEG